jgi:prepilin-type N-terminal cleavage/methylation domain-containing protein
MRNNEGFTLIEVMTVIVITATLLAIAVPQFALLQANARVASVANDLGAALKQSRSEALVQRRNMQLAAIGPTVSGNVWGGNGWQIKDPVTNKVFLEQRNIPPTIIVNSNPTDATIVFLAATGMITKVDTTLVDMVYTVCDSSTSNEKGIDVSMSRLGRITVVRHAAATTCNP